MIDTTCDTVRYAVSVAVEDAMEDAWRVAVRGDVDVDYVDYARDDDEHGAVRRAVRDIIRREYP